MALRQTRRTISLMAAMLPLIREAAAAKGIAVSQYTHEALSERLLDEGYAPPAHVPLPKRGPDSAIGRKRIRRALGLTRRGAPGTPPETRLEIVRAATRPGPQPSCVELADTFGVSASTIRRVLRGAGVPVPPPGRRPGIPHPHRSVERRDQARTMRAEGRTLDEIAGVLGVSRERARQLSVKTFAGEVAA